MKRESRTGIGPSSQRVMVNNGPKVEEVQKATGKTFRAVPIQEAARRTTMAYKHGDTKHNAPNHEKEAAAAQDPDHKDKDNAPGGDRSGSASGGPWQSGGGHGHAGGGRGKGHG